MLGAREPVKTAEDVGGGPGRDGMEWNGMEWNEWNDGTATVERIIVVHTGAGGDVSGRRAEYVGLVKQALRKVQFSNKEATEEGHLQRFTEIGRVLEASELTNTGYGSCVCADGSVRCDSCVVHLGVEDGEGRQRTTTDAIGCVVCNSSRFPLADAVGVVAGRRRQPVHAGVVAPVVTVGRLERDDTLVSAPMAGLHTRVQGHGSGVQDTVGVFLLERWRGPGRRRTLMTAGSSSGGNLLRDWTRVGSAGVVGSGCWLEEHSATGDVVCTLASGQGEHLIRHDVARTVARELLHRLADDPDGCVPVQCAAATLCRPALAAADVGVVGVALAGARIDLFYVHNTASFVLGSVTASGAVHTHVGGPLRRPQHGQWPLV